MTELSNLWLFLCAIAKVLVMTGVGVGGVIVLVAECCGFRVVALGFEKFGRAVSQTNRDGLIPALSNREGNKPARNVLRRVA